MVSALEWEKEDLTLCIDLPLVEVKTEVISNYY